MKKKVFRIAAMLVLCLAVLTAAAMASGSHDCADADGDHLCDACWESITANCADADGDHACDVCALPVRTACADADGDRYCDVCGQHMVEFCADADKNHACDVCWAVLSTCLDENKNHLCDLCGGVFWVDEDADGTCDGCQAVLTHVTAEHKGVYYHDRNGITVADVVIEVTVEPYSQAGGAPAGTVQVRWTDGSGKVYATAEKALTFGQTTAVVEYPSLPLELLRTGGRVVFTPYDAAFTPAENGCVFTGGTPEDAGEIMADVNGAAWYAGAVYYALETGLMEPAAELAFDPAGDATRADLIYALWKMAGSPVVNYLMMYSDVGQEEWHAEAVRWASAMGIAKGYPDGTFRPEEAMTRQEMATFLYRYIQMQGDGFVGMWMFLLPCTDRADVAEWAYEPLCWMTMKGILNGDGTGALNPRQTATRAQMAQLLKNYLEA